MTRHNFRKALALVLILWMIVSCAASSADYQDQVLLHFPKVRQATNYTCGVASLMSILRYYGTETREDTLAAELKSTSEAGTNWRSIQQYAVNNFYDVEVFTDMSINDLKVFILAGKPVLVVIQAWPTERPLDWKEVWDSGHYVVAVGFDSTRLLFMDPSTLGNFAYIHYDEFLDRWHDIDSDNVTKLMHFGMVISKPKPDYNPYEILKLN